MFNVFVESRGTDAANRCADEREAADARDNVRSRSTMTGRYLSDSQMTTEYYNVWKRDSHQRSLSTLWTRR